MRAQCATPIAMGELFNNPHEWTPLITGRLIDLIRCHVSQVGGVSVARKIHCWQSRSASDRLQGPRDVSPVRHTAQLHLDLARDNPGIQEGGLISGVSAEIFNGCATLQDGYLWASDAPGWGIEVDEELAVSQRSGCPH